MMDPRNRDPNDQLGRLFSIFQRPQQPQGPNIPGNFENNLNSISRQSPTGKFVSESVRGQGMGNGNTGFGSLLPPLFDAWQGARGGSFGNTAFSGAGTGRNVNTGVSSLNSARARRS